MATFPAPHVDRWPFQPFPEAGSRLTETALLQFPYAHLKPLETITDAFVIAHDEMGEGEAADILVECIHSTMEQAVLLQAWHEHQPRPRRRGTPQADPAAAEPGPEADEEEEEPSSPPPARRRSRLAPDA